MDYNSQRGKGLWQQWLKENIYYSYILTCSVESFGFFIFFFFNFPFFPHLCCHCRFYWHYSSVSKESACSAGDPGSIPGLERFPGEENGNPFQYSCLENPMDRGAWQATVHGLARVRHDLMTKPPPSNLIKLLRFFFSFFFFFPVTFFIVVINLCPYVGLLQFWGVFLLFIYFFPFSFLIFLTYNYFFYIYSFVCFSYCSFLIVTNLSCI